MDKRPYYNKGTCLNLKTSPYILFLFVDDDESFWSESEIIDYWYNNIEAATSFIENEAKKYHYDIKIDKGYYATGIENLRIKYDDVVNTVLEGPIQYDIMDKIALCLGFESKHDMHSWLKNQVNNEQVGYIVVLNKEGHSHCVNTDDKNFDELEFVFQFARHTGQDRGYPAALAHEILHLFGAEDCYDPFGKMPKRKNKNEEF